MAHAPPLPVTIPSPRARLLLEALVARIDDVDAGVEPGVARLDVEEVWPLWRAFSREGLCECRAVTDESVARFAGWLVRRTLWETPAGGADA